VLQLASKFRFSENHLSDLQVQIARQVWVGVVL
jgi:hypothetical protein